MELKVTRVMFLTQISGLPCPTLASPSSRHNVDSRVSVYFYELGDNTIRICIFFV